MIITDRENFIGFYVDPELKQAVRDASESKRVKMSQYCREAIAEKLAKDGTDVSQLRVT